MLVRHLMRKLGVWGAEFEPLWSREFGSSILWKEEEAMEVAAAEAAVPIAVPLTSLKQLESRTLLASSTYLKFATSSFPLPSSLKAPDRPRLLVCHDFKGGYQEDKWIQGCSFSEAYSLWHWHLIDVFVYFSHSLVTLPPQGWINAAHKHGVKVSKFLIRVWSLL